MVYKTCQHGDRYMPCKVLKRPASHDWSGYRQRYTLQEITSKHAFPKNTDKSLQSISSFLVYDEAKMQIKTYLTWRPWHHPWPAAKVAFQQSHFYKGESIVINSRKLHRPAIAHYIQHKSPYLSKTPSEKPHWEELKKSLSEYQNHGHERKPQYRSTTAIARQAHLRQDVDHFRYVKWKMQFEEFWPVLIYYIRTPLWVPYSMFS